MVQAPPIARQKSPSDGDPEFPARHSPSAIHEEPPLRADNDRQACTSFRTLAAYRSYLRGIAAWIRATQTGSDRDFKGNASSVVREGVINMILALADDVSLLPILKLCLASLVYYYEFLSSELPTTHALRVTTLFRRCESRSHVIDQLVQHESSWMTATGIPLQVVMFGLQEEIHATVCALPESLATRFAKLLEEKGICGGITQQQLEGTIRRVWEEREPCSNAIRPCSTSPRTTIHFWPSDGKLHALPERFEFLSTDVLHAWQLWWFGSEAVSQPLYKSVSTQQKRTYVRVQAEEKEKSRLNLLTLQQDISLSALKSTSLYHEHFSSRSP